MFDDRPKWLETIDELVTEKRQELDRLHNLYTVNGECWCSLCRTTKERVERRERELFELEQQLDIPYHLRYYNTKRENK